MTPELMTFAIIAVTAVIAGATGWLVGRALARQQLQAEQTELARQSAVERAALAQQLALAEQRVQQAQQAATTQSATNEQLATQLESVRTAERQAVTLASTQAERAQQWQQRAQVVEQQQRDANLELQQLRNTFAEVQTELAELKTARIKEQEAMAEKLALLDSGRAALKEEFALVANRIFEDKQLKFGEQSTHQLQILMQPFREQLDAFRTRVDEIHRVDVEGQSTLKSELERLRLLNQQITEEAQNLTRALKGDKKMQGTWGEQQVELLLEKSGLKKGEQYAREASFRDDEGNQKRPDFIVHLPDHKHIIIDSKVSLVDYTRYVEAQTDDERRQSLAAHVQALRNHVTTLSARNYPGLAEMNSPDFTFLFLPIEPSYQVAVEFDPALFQWAYEQNIAIVTATTLMPMLRVIANLWSLQRQNQFSRELADQAGKVHDKLASFIETMDKLGNQLESAGKSYRKAFDQLKDGRGSLVRQVERFVDLGAKTSKKLPASVAGTDDEVTELLDDTDGE